MHQMQSVRAFKHCHYGTTEGPKAVPLASSTGHASAKLCSNVISLVACVAGHFNMCRLAELSGTLSNALPSHA